MKAVAVVGPRLNSSRLPGKHLLDLAGQPLIARIFERLDAVPELDAAVLATTSDAFNGPLVDWANQAGRAVLAYDGDVNDLMGRVDAAFAQAGAEILIYICGDCPLIEPSFISRALRALAADTQADCVTVAAPPGRRVIHQGIDFFRADYWRRLLALSQTASEREHVGSARHKLTGRVRAAQVIEPEHFFCSYRISVDTASDYRFMSALYQRWYASHAATAPLSLDWVIDELAADPALAAINAEVHQKSVDEVSVPVLLVGATGPAVGLGHLRRLLVLAERLVDRHAAGVRLLLLGQVPQLAALRLWNHSGCERLEEGLARLIAERMPRAIVFDLPRTQLRDEDRALLQSLTARGIALFSIDGAVPWPDVLRVDFVPSFYMAPQAAAPHRLWGWQRYLLPRFAKAKRTGLRLLVMTGGSDLLGLGETWPRLLDRQLPAGLEVVWVRGPFAPAPNLPPKPRCHWQVSDNPADPYAAMADASHALVVYGVSLFECLAHGLACVALLPPYLDAGEAAAFEATEVAWSSPDPTVAVARLEALLRDTAAADALSARAHNQLAGDGAAELAALVLGKGS